LQGSAIALGTAASLQRVSAQPQKSVLSREDSFPSYVDGKTGVTVYNLTPGDQDSQVMYQTHPMWTQKMDYFLFYSHRSGEGMRPHLLEMQTGEVQPLIRERYQQGTMSWQDNLMYYIADHELFAIEVIQAFHKEGAPRLIGRIPEAYRKYSGDITVDADGSALYFGAQLDETGEKYAVAAMNLKSGETRIVAETDFKVGHFQANPFRPGQIMFCWETGGDAPQRSWLLNADDAEAKPLYKESYNEWVTHEVWWGADHIVFTIWPKDDEMRAKPHGIAEASLETGPAGRMNILAQYPAWHTHGSPDRNWALGDDFDRNLWLVNVATRERKLLSQGHVSGDYKTHLHSSFTPDSKGVVFTSSKDGVENIFYIALPEWETLA
jgi:oligogalacturonide lyase